MEFKLTINKNYADKYNAWRGKEEYNKLKDKYGDVDLSSSSDESEDDDAEALTEQIDQEWFNTLAALKRKDPRIYNKDNVFFQNVDEDSDEDSGKKKKKKEKMSKKNSMTAAEYTRNIVMKKADELDIEGNDQSDSEYESDFDDTETRRKKAQKLAKAPGYYEEQDQIKRSFKEAAGEDDDDNDEDEGFASSLFTSKSKTEEEEEKEHTDYIEWLKGDSSQLVDKSVSDNLTSLRDYWNKPDLDDDDRFLRDYILNKRYICPDDNGSDSDGDENNMDQIDLEEDEKDIKKQEAFENSYNFRFEEPDQQFIKQHPRVVDDSIRFDDQKRRKHRETVRERKRAARKKVQEEIKQMKNLKRQEIAEKIQKLKAVTGNERLGFDTSELEGDFDPKEYDQMMKGAFSTYDDEVTDETEKPVFEYEHDIDGEEDDVDWDSWQVTNDDEGNEIEGDDFNMDADYNPEVATMSKKQQKRLRNSKFLQALRRKVPTYNPDDQEFADYFNEYYDLDYDDIIDGQPIKFKYRNVEPNDFGLDITEILNGDDRELNKWNSFKQMMTVKTDEEEKRLVRTFARHANNVKHKATVMPSLYMKKKKKKEKTEEEIDISDEGFVDVKKKSTKRKQKTDDDGKILKKKVPSSTIVRDEPKQLLKAKPSHKSQKNHVTNKKEDKKLKQLEKTMGVSDERLQAYGITNVRQFRITHVVKEKHRKKDKKPT